MKMVTNLEAAKKLMRDIQSRVSQVELFHSRHQLEESLKAHQEALVLKRVFAVERASFGLANHTTVCDDLSAEFELIKKKVSNALETLRQYTREFAAKGVLEMSNA